VWSGRRSGGVFTDEEIEALRAAARFDREEPPRAVALPGGRLELALEIPANGIVFVRIRRT
jgi:hypothetical protein